MRRLLPLQINKLLLELKALIYYKQYKGNRITNIDLYILLLGAQLTKLIMFIKNKIYKDYGHMLPKEILSFFNSILFSISPKGGKSPVPSRPSKELPPFDFIAPLVYEWVYSSHKEAFQKTYEEFLEKTYDNILNMYNLLVGEDVQLYSIEDFNKYYAANFRDYFQEYSALFIQETEEQIKKPGRPPSTPEDLI